MKQFILSVFVLFSYYSFSQEKEFLLQGQIVDRNNNPISDGYIFNERSSVKSVSKDNGVFDVLVLPGDSIIISHISFIRKLVSVHQLMVNPVVQLDLDTVNIRPVNISASEKSEYEKAMKNIESIEFDLRPQPDDEYTESERMTNLLNTENQVERAYSNSLNLMQFSPSEEIGKLISKRKKKKAAKQFSST
ncbi:MAG TPA: hypothetical protein PLC80_06970, partial [Draconibacterium sp.]|nr:hypothetical protein [Draconibacterium sp.]